mgnify:CR=1 FL=1
MVLTPEKKCDIFRMLGSKSIVETGLEFGFDKHYKDTTAVKNAVYKIYRQISQEPEKYPISPDVVEFVKGIMQTRSVSVRKPTDTPTLAEKNEGLLNQDFKDILVQGRKKAFSLLNSKLDRIGSSKKRLDEVNISSLAQVFGILFDKAQIIQGEATENIAVLAKVDKDMSPEDALQAVLRSREANQLDKDRTNKKK